jgi:type I restriction enzyme M protein
MTNERITEDIVRSHFKNDPLFKSIKLEEQKSFSKRIIDLLQTSSKKGNGIGRPEFIISFPTSNLDYVIVIECKADVKYHRSKKLDNPEGYAVDGVLHYAKNLSREFDVVAIAISGQTKVELKTSHFLWSNGDTEYKELTEDKDLLAINDYLKLFNNEQFSANLKNVDIIRKAIDLNELYHSYSITETTRCTIVSAILLSLLDIPFRKGYKDYSTTSAIGSAMLAAIANVLTAKSVKSEANMLGEYRKILNEPLFQQDEVKHKERKEREKSVFVVKEMIHYLHKNVFPLIDMEDSGFDVLGRFYTEFIRYAGSEQSQGLVLTPFHITDLFCDLANLKVSSLVYDPVCGTAGFLIAAMKRMLDLAGNNTKRKNLIRSIQLVGVELRPSMFTYACSNMMLRGDGKSNIYCGDCFQLKETILSHHEPDVSFLNPPYDVGAARQLEFIEHALEVVAPKNGTVIAIVQIGCCIKNEKEIIEVKNRLLAKHRLHAVLSMPDELFNPSASVVTSVLVFKANEENKGRKTWFGYFKNDGFVKRKHRGRVDARGTWNSIKSEWIDAYNNLDEIPGLSGKMEVTGKDEWCAEAYLKTDYTILTNSNFERKIIEFISYKVRLSYVDITVTPMSPVKPINLNITTWRTFKYGGDDGIFSILNGYYNKKPEHTENGDIPFIGATEYNNGVTETYTLSDIEDNNKDERSNEHSLDKKLFKANCITVSNNGSVGSAFYQINDFTCSHDVNVLLLKNRKWNSYIGMFIATIIELEKFRWTFGRKWRPARMPESEINLPVTKHGEPDWEFMETYIKSLPYSASL